MPHEFLVKDIAFQAGLSTATVDRVLHGRPGVRIQTVRRVEAAVRELGEQQADIPGRPFAIDVVMAAPDRFTEQVRDAFESEGAALVPALFRSRFHLNEVLRPQEIVHLLDRIRLRGTDGVVLKAQDIPAVNAAVERLEQAGIPVVTLVTDLPQSPRSAYAGADNRAAGETAAYLIGERIAGVRSEVLVTLSSSRFRGEEERESAFRRVIRERYPAIGIVEISEGNGTDEATRALASDALARHPDINATYSIGGGNRAVLDSFSTAARTCTIFVAHDLDQDNLSLLKQNRIHFVLHHDLKSDARTALRAILARHSPGARRMTEMSSLSAMNVITPYNIPSPFR